MQNMWRVVSKEIKKEIEDQLRAQSAIIDDYAKIQDVGRISTSNDAGSAEDSQIQNALNRIEKNKQKLPESATPEPPRMFRPAVTTRQEIGAADGNNQNGKLHITILKPIKYATGSGKFEPEMKKRSASRERFFFM